MVREQLAALTRPCGPGRARIRRSHAALLPDTELRGALARRRARRAHRNGRDRNPEGRVFILYWHLVLLSDGLRGARHHPDLSVMDVHIVDGGLARRGGRRGAAEL